MAALSERESTELFELLPVSLQQACARGDVDLDELLEQVTNPQAAEICPWCGVRPVHSKRHGICWVCSRQRLNEALSDKVAELEVLRVATVEKKRLQRLRDTLDPDRPRRRMQRKTAEDYGLASMTPTSHPLHRQCDACGERFPDHGEATCPRCQDRAE